MERYLICSFQKILDVQRLRKAGISLINVPIKSSQFVKWQLFSKFYEPFFVDFWKDCELVHFLHINMFFFYVIYIIFLLRRTRWVSDALKDLRGRFSIFASFCRKCLPFNFQFLSKMLLMCFFFWSKKLYGY